MAGPISNSEIKSTGAPSNRRFAFIVMTSLFFIWGFITALNDVLIPHLKAAFELSYLEAGLVQFCFFGAYFVVSPFAGRLIEKVGFKKGVIFGLLGIAAGCCIFYPAAELEIYLVFLFALFVLASGITILQVSANPYVVILGEARTAASRLNLAQAINSLGHTLGPMFGAALIFGGGAAVVTAEAVQLPYLILAGVALATAGIFMFLKLPVIESDDASTQSDTSNDSVWQHKRLVYGAVAIFMYVGAEVSVGSYLVNYFAESHIMSMNNYEASKMISYYWGAALIGRFIGAALTYFIKPNIILAVNSVLAIACIFMSVSSEGPVAMWTILAVGLFNSIMFPTIFSMAITGLGKLTSRGSGLLVQGIVGGALLPLLQGLVADLTSVQMSFLVPAFAYIYISWYALSGSKADAADKAAAIKAEEQRV
jgi:FHS family L-fucose permease-like MFS transporter